jgi:hypothetical protein
MATTQIRPIFELIAIIHRCVQRHVTVFICYVNRCGSASKERFQHFQIATSRSSNVKAGLLSTIRLHHKLGCGVWRGHE